MSEKLFLLKQKAILDIFQHVYQTDLYNEQYIELRKFSIEDNIDRYENVKLVQEFLRLYKDGMLPVHYVFTVKNQKHLDQAVALFYVFYYAKDWDTFYKTMIWARYNINPGMFVYALTVAIVQRPDMVDIVLPSPYEINPYYFYNSSVIQKAQSYKMQGFYGMNKVQDTYNVVINTNNYTKDDEWKLSYFTEDVGLNAFFYNFQLNYPTWFEKNKHGVTFDKQDELYFETYKGLLARYYFERLSNGYGQIPEFSWYHPIENGYHSYLKYYNGKAFPVRNNFYQVYNKKTYNTVDNVRDLEVRLAQYFDSDFKKFDFSQKRELFNEYFFNAKQLLSYNFYDYDNNAAAKYNVTPGTLQHYETEVRDPMFYQLHKRFHTYYRKYVENLPSYDRSKIVFDGVSIDAVKMDKLVTYFDYFDADITNAVDIEGVEQELRQNKVVNYGRISHNSSEKFAIRARQRRLTHLPFTYKLDVQSDREQKVVVKVFMGPKYDEFGREFTLDENRENFYVLDYAVVDLKKGKNVVARNCEEFPFFVKDRPTYNELYKELLTSMKDGTKFEYAADYQSRFPWRLMLPKGQVEGMATQLFFVILPYSAVVPYESAFPLGRKIDYKNWFTTNMYYHDTVVYHKQEIDLNNY